VDQPEREPVAFPADGTRLSGELSGPHDGIPVVLLHGLTATRRYVVMGSLSLQRSGHRVLAYDARGHGTSAPAAEGDYGYPRLASDLDAALDAAGFARAVLAGASMGAQTATRLALEHPDRVAALALVTPAYDPAHARSAEELARWDALAEGLRGGGVEGFIAAYELDKVSEALRPTVETVLRQRLSAHEHPLAVADALEAVPRSAPFEDPAELSALAVPTVVVGSRDEHDPGHPLAVAERWAQWIPGSRLVVEEQDRSPLAWQGGQLSRVIAELAASAA
jgi:pimeloyl-ACP methyl ester carboxylesterase